MKKIVIQLTLMIITFSGFSQLAKENTFQGKLKTINLENEGEKYLSYDSKNDILEILNTDGSKWKSVSLPLGEGHYLDQVKHVSKKTLNEDEWVEVVYTTLEFAHFSSYENPDETDHPSRHKIHIVNEKGENLLLEEGGYDFKVVTVDNNRNLLIYKNVKKGFQINSETVVYAIK